VLLNQALTQPQVELRILGQSKMVSAQTRALITATVNNLVVTGDLIRRFVVGKLDPRCERPELRQYDYDPIADAMEMRGEIVVAALTVLRAYHVAGRPQPPPRLQNFGEWSDTVRATLIWLGQGDPVKTMGHLRMADPALVNLRAVLAAWRDEFADAAQSSNTVIEAANATKATEEPQASGRYVRSYIRPALRNAILTVAGRGGAIEARVFGQWLGRNKHRVVNLGQDDDAKDLFALKDLVALEPAALLHGSQQWKVVNRESAP
jgi:putative DNA primase/helicase